MVRHSFAGLTVDFLKLLLSSTLVNKSHLTFIYFTTFEKKRRVISPYPHNQAFWFIVKYISISLSISLYLYLYVYMS